MEVLAVVKMDSETIKEDSSDQDISIADKYIKEGRYEEAILIYRKLVEMRPSEDSFLLNLAWAYHDGGQLLEAIDCFEQLFEREVQQAIFTGFAYDELVRIFKSKSLYERLINICEKAVQLQPDDTGFLGDLGDSYLKAGLAEKAVEIFARMIKIDPAEADFYCRLGSALIYSGDVIEAENAYKKAAEMDNSAAGYVYNKQADVYSRAGYNERAELAQLKSIECCSDEPLYYLNLGDILAKQQRFVEARNSYQQAVSLKPVDAPVYYNRLGNMLARLNCHKQAIDAFLQAIALDSENPFYYLNAAEGYKALGLDKNAEKYLQKAENCKRNVKHDPFSS